MIAGRERGWTLANYLWTLAKQELAAGHHAAALRASAQSTLLQQARRGRLGGGSTSNAALWWTHHRALLANGKTASAYEANATAYALLVRGVHPLSDEGLRRSYLQQAFSDHADLLHTWVHAARKAGLPRERYTAHLQGSTNLQESVQRLVDTGLRLNEQTTSSALHAFLIEEVAELLGARRVLLVLQTADGPAIAGAQVPEGEAADALLHAITPWLDEARRTLQTSLRHGPEGVDELDQRGCLIVPISAPLVAQQQLLGFIYADLDGLFGRFHDTDCHLLATLASQAAVALANLRTQEGLERQVAERTAAAEQRAAELAVINRIQQAVGAALNFQAIVDSVGDRLREVFNTGDMSIRWYDEAAGAVHSMYSYEHGQRLESSVDALKPGTIQQRFYTVDRQTVSIGSVAEQLERGAPVTAGTDRARSLLIVPMLAGERMLGSVYLENHERDQAFGAADERLVSTIASSMGVALLNAKSFEAERQRAAELAIINAVQQALAGELSMQGVYEAVGEKLREVFPRFSVIIRRYDRASGLLHFPFFWLDEAHVQAPPGPLAGLGAEVVRTRRTLLIDHDLHAAAQRLGSRQVVSGVRMPKSIVVVPMLAGDDVIGMLELIDTEREHAFSQADVSLLETIAASMSVALENTRLFDETQRLLKETERRSAELAVINTIQQGMAREMNFRAIVELVGDKLREVFASNDISIHSGNLVTMQAQALYVVERGERKQFPDYNIDPAQPVVQRNMRGEVVLARSPAEIAQVMGLTVETLDTELEQFPGTHQSKTIVWVPVNAGPERLYALVLESADREDAFSEADIGLLQTVATSMGMALENARLFSETQAALQRQTASADILRVISQSPTDVKPVFDAITLAAVRLLQCDFTNIMSSDGRTYSPVSGATREGLTLNIGLPNQPVDPAANLPSRAIVSKTMLHLPDWTAIELPPHAKVIYDSLGVRSALYLPLLRGVECIGLLVYGMSRPHVFSAQDIAVAESFRDQALIAIENTRLFNETQEALERQTASAEVLQAISGSMADTQPVFERIVASSARLFGTDEVMLLTLDEAGERLHLRGHRGAMAEAAKALFPIALAGTGTELCMRQRRVMRFDDAMNGAESPPGMRGHARQLGFSWSAVEAPMLIEGRGIGSIMVFRRDMRAFTEAEARTLQTFADQAVIAIQNTRLFNETKEALEQQTATAEVLQVISQSVADAQPVFDKILDSCQRLFGADSFGIDLLDEQGQVRLAFDRGPHSSVMASLGALPLDATLTGLAVRERRVVYLPDMGVHVDGPYLAIRSAYDQGARSYLTAPLLWNERGIGAIYVGSQRLNAFSQGDAALL